jgi:MFS family permease
LRLDARRLIVRRGGFVNSKAFLETLDIDGNSSSGTDMIALIVAIYEVGAFLGAILTSFIGEPLGRRKTIGAGVIIMIIGI